MALVLFRTLLISTLLGRLAANFNFEEIERVVYDVSLDGEPFGAQALLNAKQSRDTPLPASELFPDLAESSTVVLASEYGQKFVCDIPDVSKYDEEKSSVSDFGNFTAGNVTDLISVAFSLRPCLQKTVDWWTYEFCFGREVQQYHLSGKNIVGDVVSLGYFGRNFDLPELTANRRKQLHFSQMYNGGTVCELSSQMRKTEVRFFCDDGLGSTDAFIYRVDEPATCQYQLTVHVGSLCALKAFAPVEQPATPQAVVCRPLLSAEQTDAYVQKKADLERRVAQQEHRKRRDQELKKQEQELERRRLRYTERRLRKEQKGLTDSMVDQYRSVMETAVRKQASALGEDPESFKVVNFDLNLFGDTEETEEDETDEDRRRGDLWFYFNDKRWNKKDFPSEGAVDVVAHAHAEDEDLDDFERQLQRLSSGAISGVDKKALKNQMIDEFEDIIAEAKKEVPVEDETRAERNGVAALQKTLAKLLDSLEKVEQKVKGSVEPPPSVAAEEKAIAGQFGAVDDRVKVRVRKVDSASLQDDTVRRTVNTETQKLEEQLTDRLKKAGFNAKGHKVQVKVITSGFYDEQKEEFHVLSAEESEQFSNLIVSILGGDNEQSQETSRQQVMETNYLFNWEGDDTRQKTK